MIWRLLVFLYNLNLEEQKQWRKKYNSFHRKCKINEKIVKSDNSLMTPTEQIQFFADSASSQGIDVVCYLFRENDDSPIFTTNDQHRGELCFPIILMNDGEYAGTSNNNILFNFWAGKPK